MGLTLFLRPGWRSELTLRPQEAEVMCDSASAPERQPTQGTKFGGQPGNDQFSRPLFFMYVLICVCVIGGTGQTGVFTKRSGASLHLVTSMFLQG